MPVAELLNEKKVLLFILLVFPGLVSMVVYRLLLPAKAIEWKNAIVEGLFYSIVNFGLCSPLLVLIDLWRVEHPVYAALLLPIVMLIAPIGWPILLVRLLRWKWLVRRLQLPFPTGWDFFFHQKNECFVLLRLRNGDRIGGFFGAGSYAGSFPNHGDIYVRNVYKVTEEGVFLDPVPLSLGFWIRKSEYSVIEFFEVPPPAG